jgi:histidinol phosphatase-like enzyme
MVTFDNTNTFMDDPAYSETRLVIVSEDDGIKRGYISGDGNKLLEFTGKSLNEILIKIEEKCKDIIEG